MATSNAVTVHEYLEGLPADRRAVVASLRDIILGHLPDGYQETLRGGAINYEIPLARYPTTYNKQPLPYITLAAQKNHYALYLISVYQDPAEEAWLREQFALAGKKIDLGKSCLRFRSLNDLPLDAIGQLVARTPPEAHIARYEVNRQRAQ